MAKAKVEETGMALKACLDSKKVINEKLAAIEKARAVAQQKLDECLSTKTKLKAALEECHTRRDAARAKLQECLDRKKALKPKIELCHKKRDEARAKLAQCLEAKKALAGKIAAAKAKLGKFSAASFMEVMENEGRAEGPIEDLEAALAELEFANDEFESTKADMEAVGDLISSAVADLESAGAEEKKIAAKIMESEMMQGDAETSATDMQNELADALQQLQKIDADSDAAATAAASAVKAVDSASASLLAFESKR